jgi:UDP-N-acetylmuramoyl-L-alanyl-D-glutamate--2,6-diaminopimelate ligase
MRSIKSLIYAVLPRTYLEETLLPAYHRTLAFLGALWHGFAGRKLYIIGVTGTKGKTTTTEILNAILEEAGYNTALCNGIRFKIGEESERNLTKMSMPGRFFLQGFLDKARVAGCTHAIVEMTSEGARLYRHEWIPLDAFIFTNLSPEHIERHGSFEKYRDAKLRIRDALVKSKKKYKVVVSNRDDDHGALFMDVPEHITRLPYSLKQAEPYSTNTRVSLFTFHGVSIHTSLLGTFNISNMLACATLARHMDIDTSTIKRALETIPVIPGRAQKIDEGQPFTVVVDYAHTAESLDALYRTFPHERKICVLGACGGGRDRWKRAKMAHVVETYCDEIIFTDEDPYDEDPQEIISDLQKGLEKKEATVIMDRREAIRHALSKARERTAVLITGKGTDPYIMKARGEKMPWSDEQVVREELRKMREEEKIDEQHEKEK